MARRCGVRGSHRGPLHLMSLGISLWGGRSRLSRGGPPRPRPRLKLATQTRLNPPQAGLRVEISKKTSLRSGVGVKSLKSVILTCQVSLDNSPQMVNNFFTTSQRGDGVNKRTGQQPCNDLGLLRDVVYAECHDAIVRRNPDALNDFRAAYRTAQNECESWWDARKMHTIHQWLQTFGVYLPSKRGLIPLRRCTRGPQTPPRRKRNT